MFLGSKVIVNWLFVWLLSFMNSFNMSFHMLFLWSRVITFERVPFCHVLIQFEFKKLSFQECCGHKYYMWMFFFLMNLSNMNLQTTHLRRNVIANLTFEWILFLMNWFNVFLQVKILVVGLVTNVIFEWLLLIMNWFYVFLQVKD